MGVHCDSHDGETFPTVGLPYTPVRTPVEMLDDLRGDLGQLLEQVAKDPARRISVQNTLAQRLWAIRVNVQVTPR